MIRIQTYNSAPRRVQAGGINPGNQPALRTVSGRAEDRTLAAMLQSGLKLTDIAVKEYVQKVSGPFRGYIHETGFGAGI